MNPLWIVPHLCLILFLRCSEALITPCVRVCRYNADCFDGVVCIGCFRESFEIANWASMTPQERAYALQDAADRWEDGYDGSISRQELLDQAKMWQERARHEG